MPPLKYAKPERISLKDHPDFNERWLQDRIGEDPSLLGLGDLVLKDRERIQPHAGRLDLLLQDAESNKRYEVEIQLGKTDEAHVIRAIEYWDIERKRYRIRLSKGDITKHNDFLRTLLTKAYNAS